MVQALLKNQISPFFRGVLDNLTGPLYIDGNQMTWR